MVSGIMRTNSLHGSEAQMTALAFASTVFASSHCNLDNDPMLMDLELHLVFSLLYPGKQHAVPQSFNKHLKNIKFYRHACNSQK